jgi:hypothetical protein
VIPDAATLAVSSAIARAIAAGDCPGFGVTLIRNSPARRPSLRGAHGLRDLLVVDEALVEAPVLVAGEHEGEHVERRVVGGEERARWA